MQKQIFVSYSRSSLGTVKCLVHDLREQNLNVWVDYDCLLPGQDWKSEITRAIHGSDYFLICVSAAMTKPGYFNVELKEALESAKRMPEGQIYIIPIVLDDTPRGSLPWGLSRYQCERLVGGPLQWDDCIRKLGAAVGAPSSLAFGDAAEADYRRLTGRYFSHVNWWLFGRAIKPNESASERDIQHFAEASVNSYMIPYTQSSILVCGPHDPSYPLMMQLYDRLYPNIDTIASRSVPVIVVLEDPANAASCVQGIVTPSDLVAKWEQWYVKKESISPNVWFKNPRYCLIGQSVKEAYGQLKTILTGLPVLYEEKGNLAGFLPHYGTREDWSAE